MTVSKITRFEHQELHCGENELTKAQYEALVRWYDKKRKKAKFPYFSLVRNGIKFKSWVGVLQVGSAYIEVLPKIASKESTDDEEVWRNRLCHMLTVTKSLNIHQTEEAELKVKSHTLWDIFYQQYIRLVRDLVRMGLVKTYRMEEGNRNALKGKILWGKHIQKNVIHKERFYTEASVYNQNHLVNRILVTALKIATEISCVSNDANKLLFELENIEEIKPNAIRWDYVERLKQERKTTAYAPALNLSRLIIENNNPDLNKGNNNINALMFDMNALFEKYVAQKLSKLYPGKIFAQRSRAFWNGEYVKPDVIYSPSGNMNDQGNIVLDTKWKCVKSKDDISSADVYQMFAYSHKFKATKVFLIYPWLESSSIDGLIDEANVDLGNLPDGHKFDVVTEYDSSLGILHWKWF